MVSEQEIPETEVVAQGFYTTSVPFVDLLVARDGANAISRLVVLSGMMSAPEIPTNVLISGFLSAWLSQRYALKKYPEWYEKYSKSYSHPQGLHLRAD